MCGKKDMLDVKVLDTKIRMLANTRYRLVDHWGHNYVNKDGGDIL